MKIIIEITIDDPSITETQAKILAKDISFKSECTMDQTKFRNEYEVSHKIDKE